MCIPWIDSSIFLSFRPVTRPFTGSPSFRIDQIWLSVPPNSGTEFPTNVFASRDRLSFFTLIVGLNPPFDYSLCPLTDLPGPRHCFCCLFPIRRLLVQKICLSFPPITFFLVFLFGQSKAHLAHITDEPTLPQYFQNPFFLPLFFPPPSSVPSDD